MPRDSSAKYGLVLFGTSRPMIEVVRTFKRKAPPRLARSAAARWRPSTFLRTHPASLTGRVLFTMR
ncbi:hypothetical protein P4133_03785 [Pseudomonas aeruginosa]|nr:hypothetical protein [Pseudomonas aeruginosa]